MCYSGKTLHTSTSIRSEYLYNTQVKRAYGRQGSEYKDLAKDLYLLFLLIVILKMIVKMRKHIYFFYMDINRCRIRENNFFAKNF